jgi:hypothetical protein
MTNADERDVNTTNDTEVEEVTSEHDETTETTTEDSDTSTQPSADEAPDETVTINRADYEKLQRELAANARLRKEAKERRENGSSKGKEDGQALDKDLIDRTYLAAQAGVKDMDVQDEALRLARKFDMTIVEALKDADIASRLENLQKKKKAQAAVASGTGGAKVANKGMDYYVAEFKRSGTLPDDPKIVAKMLDHLV